MKRVPALRWHLSCNLFIIYLFILSFIYHLFIYLVCRSLEPATPNTGKSFRNLIKSNRNQIVFTIFRLIWNTKRTCPFVFQINWKMVNTIWFRFYWTRFRKHFHQCGVDLPELTPDVPNLPPKSAFLFPAHLHRIWFMCLVKKISFVLYNYTFSIYLPTNWYLFGVILIGKVFNNHQ